MAFDETALVARAAKGDLTAFNDLVRAYEHLAYNVALRMLRNADEAADVTQESFIVAYDHLAELRGAFRPWMLRIVVNRCYDALRRRQRGPRSLDALVDERAVPLAGESADPEAAALSAELTRAIAAGIQGLPPDQRATIVLVDIQGLSYDEAAAVLQVPIGTVRSRLFRARARLRDALLAQGKLIPARYRPHVETES